MKRTGQATGRWLAPPYAALGCAISLALLAGLHQLTRAHGLPLLIPSLAASAALVLVEPDAPSAQPYSTIAGQTLSALLAVVSVSLLGAGNALAVGAAAGGAVLSMQLTRSFHPPGAATAVFLAMTLPGDQGLDLRLVLIPVTGGAVLVVVGARLAQSLRTFVCGRISPPVVDHEASRSLRPTPLPKEAICPNK